MKKQINLTTDSWDLARYPTHEALLELLEGFDGLELMYFEPDAKGQLSNELVVGYHSNFYNHWLDFYQGNEVALIEEHGSLERCYQHFGGTDRSALITRLSDELTRAESYEAEYMVLHVADCTSLESFTGNYRHSHEEVIDALCSMVNEVFTSEHSIGLLFENLWVPGLTLTNPALTKRLMESVEYKNKGIMLDTGHLFHTNTSLRTPEEGLAYINSVIDTDEELIGWVKGIHLNQSVTGAYFEQIKAHPPVLSTDPSERGMQVFTHIYTLDVHEPFVAPGVGKLVERLDPDYLTFEFITGDNEQQRRYIKAQQQALQNSTD